MRVKNSNLEWNVFIHDFNSDKIIKYNVLYNVAEKLHKAVKKGQVNDKATLKEWLKNELMYHYWSRCEYEILVSGLFSKANDFKMDAWDQIEINLDNVVEYVNWRCDLKY